MTLYWRRILMQKMIFKAATALLLLATVTYVQAQETLTGLQFNESVKKASVLVPKETRQTVQHPLHLPFFDDFSEPEIYPSPKRWTDRNVFVNRDFAVFPTNTGAATFDVLDDKGAVYSHAVSVPFEADFLTSVAIRLDSVFSPVARAISPADSVYLSFYYQPQGRGDRPEINDSLVLQLGFPTGNMILDYIDSTTFLIDSYLLENGIDFIFPFDTIWAPSGCNPAFYLVNYSTLTWGDLVTLPCDSVMKPEISWVSVWNAPGKELAEFVDIYGTYFRQVLIPVKDPKFFTAAFQFRFFNYGSIANDIIPSKRSNVDQWNLDFVYLNINRTIFDTTYRMLSFTERAPSFLKRYESMPYRQYRSDPVNATAPEFKIYLTNLDQIEHNTKYRYVVKQVNGSFGFGYDGGSCNLPPFYVFGYQNCATNCGAAHACPPVNSVFGLDFSLDSTSFHIIHYLSDSSGSNILVDSIRYKQGFYNYFAYDDGTPELGYGLEPAGGLLAYQFKLASPDTIKGVQIYFNRTLNNANDKYFDIVVWKDNNGKPGEEVYRKKRQRPQWSDQLYRFQIYEFDEDVYLNGIFYIGLMQEETGSLNIGYDVSRNSQQYTFFNVDGIWRTSQFEGSLMIRPVLGSGYFIGQQENLLDTNPFTVSPNPASNSIKINTTLKDVYDLNASFYDLTGREILQMNLRTNTEIQLPYLKSGLYILHLSDNNHQYSCKLLISND